MNLLDRVIAYVSPVAATRRMAARLHLQHAELLSQTMERRVRNRAHEGADRSVQRGRSWWDGRVSPQTAIEEDLEDLRHRARELVRSDAIGGTIESRANLVVSTGFTPQARTPDAEYNRRTEARFRRWSKQVDAAGVQSLWQFSRLAEKAHAIDGECFVVASIIRGRIVLEMIDADRVETPPEYSADPQVRLGVETDASGRIVAYHIQRAHPFDGIEVDETFDRVDAGRVFHLFDPMFPGQRRGLPWLARALNRLKDAHDLDEAALIAEQIKACFAVFVKTQSDPLAMAMGAATETETSGRRLQSVEPGQIHYLRTNEDVTFSDPGSAGESYAPLQDSNRRQIAASLNFAYEMLQKDWSGTSFSGGRLVLNEQRLAARVWQKLLVEKLLSPIWEFWLKFSRDRDPDDIVDYLSDPETYSEHVWTPPAWGFAINPGEEVSANADAVATNQRLLADVLAEQGYDLEEFIERRRREKELLGDLDPPPAGNVQPGNQNGGSADL